jgi:glycosyltransferase involved in cell wall biosynthesis
MLLVSLTAAACGGSGSSSATQPAGGVATTAPETPSLPVDGKPFPTDTSEFTTEIDSPYWPMKPGSQWVFRETDAEGAVSRVVVTVLDKTKVIANGVEARIVHDQVTEGDQITEDTYDWYAQDSDGNLWYLGEDTTEYENGKPKTTMGSWEAGVDGALPGIIMPGSPQVGMAYREEYYKGHAEDGASIISTDALAKVPHGRFEHGVHPELQRHRARRDRGEDLRGRLPRVLRGMFSWLKLGVFAARLAFGRALGYRLVWTIHQVLPHEGASRLDLAAAHLLGRRADVLVAHDEETAARAAEIVGSRHVAVVPHGSYVGVYPPGEGRAAARVELGIDDERVALSFGELRGYKDMDVLVDAFAQVQAGGLLLVAGYPKDKRLAADLGEAAERDSRIRFLPRFVPDERVSDFFAVADVAVVPRGDGGTSGSLILALSFGVPVVAADTATYRELLGDGEAGWLFEPGDPVSLASALDAAFSAPEEEVRRRAEVAAAQAASLDWDESARRLAALLRGRYT